MTTSVLDSLVPAPLPGQASGAAPPQWTPGPPVPAHAAPDGSGGVTSFSDADYYANKMQSAHALSGGLPQVNLPQINTGGDPTQAQGSSGTGILALPAPGQNQEIEVSGAREAPSKEAQKTSSTSLLDALQPTSLPGTVPLQATPVPQMTGIAREPAMLGSGVAKGLVSLAGTPGDVARGITALGGLQASQELQGNPFPTPPSFAEPGQFQPLQPFTPQMLAAMPGKQVIAPPSGHNPLDTETLLGLTQKLGLTDRPDLQPQGIAENALNYGGEGMGMVLPSVLTMGASDIPAAAKLLGQGAAMGLGSGVGGTVGQAVGGTPGAVIGGMVGGITPALTAEALSRGFNAIAPLTTGARQLRAAQDLAPGNTPQVRAALENPQVLAPGSPATSYQVTGNPFLGTEEQKIANRDPYKTAFAQVRQKQAEAQVAALENVAPKSADAGGVIPWFQAKLKQYRLESDNDVANQGAVTQSAVDAMGNPIAPQNAGAVVGGEVGKVRAPKLAAYDNAIATAEERAQAARTAVGGEPAPNAVQQHGARMRGEPTEPEGPETGLLGARAPVHDAASDLFKTFNADGKLALNVAGVGDVARDLLAKVNPRMGGAVLPEESTVLNAAARLRGVELLSDLDDLRSNTGAALREIDDKYGNKSPAYRRMSILMDSIEKSLAEAAGEAAQKDAGVAQRFAEMAREDRNGPGVGESGGRGVEAGAGAGAGNAAVSGQGGAAGEGAGGPGNAQGSGAMEAQATDRIRTEGYERNADDPIKGRIEALKELATAPNLTPRERRILERRAREFAQYIEKREQQLADVSPALASRIRAIAAGDTIVGMTTEGERSGEVSGFGHNGTIGFIGRNGIGYVTTPSQIRSVGKVAFSSKGEFPVALAGAAGPTSQFPVSSRTEGQGAGRPGIGSDSNPAAVAQSTRRPESLVDFVISKGGVRDDRGDLRASDLHLVHHRAGGRLLNPKGMPADDMARLANDAGYPTKDLNAFKDALASATPVYKTSEATEAAVLAQRDREVLQEQHERMMAAANVDDASSAAGVRLSPSEHAHATELALHGAHPDEAVRQAVSAGEEDVFQRNVEHNAVGAPGVPLAAQQAEMPVGRNQLTPNFTPEARQALKQRNAAWADLKERFAKGAVGKVLQSSSSVPGGYKLTSSEVPAALFQKGVKGAEAADSLIAAMGSKEGALEVLGEYPAYDLRKSVEDMGRVNVEKYDTWMKAHQAVMDKFPELKDSFDTVRKAQAVLDDLKAQRTALDAANPLKNVQDNAAVMGRYVTIGPGGYEAADRLMRDTNGSPAAMQATRDYLASTLRDKAEREGGFDLNAYHKFMRDYGGFLSNPAMADTRAAFENAAAAQAELERVATQHQKLLDDYQTSVARHFLREDADPVIAADKILSQRDPGQDLADLGRQTSGDSVARESVQKAIIEAMLKKLSSNNLIGEDLGKTSLRNEQTQNLIGRLVGDKLDGPLKAIMTPDQMEALNNVRLDIRRGNMKAVGPRNAEGSQTSFLESARAADEHQPGVGTTIGLMTVAGEVGEKLLDTPWGKVAGAMLIPLVRMARAAGFRSIQDMKAEALLHPKQLSALYAKLPATQGEATSRLMAIQRQLAQFAKRREVRYAVPNATRAANENDYGPQQAIQ